MTKHELRSIYTKKRQNLSEDNVEEGSKKIAQQFFKHVDLSNVKFLHCFNPIVGKKEPNSWIILRQLRTSHRNINIVLPRVNDTGLLEHYPLTAEEDLVINRWGIREPKVSIPVDIKVIDLIIVPLLIADQFGNRVGYGKGFYDRYLSLCRRECNKIGFSYFEPMDKIEDASLFDVPLNLCVTPTTLYVF